VKVASEGSSLFAGRFARGRLGLLDLKGINIDLSLKTVPLGFWRLKLENVERVLFLLNFSDGFQLKQDACILNLLRWQFVQRLSFFG